MNSMINTINQFCAARLISKSIKSLLFFFLVLVSITFNLAVANTEINDIEYKNDQKVITLAPHITELVYAAGAGHKIIGTVRSSNFPIQAKQIHKIGDGLNINVEHLLTLKPDIVYAWQDNFANQKLAEKLKPFGVEVLYSAPTSIKDIPNQVRVIGKQLNTITEANTHAQALENDIENLKAKFANDAKLKVFIEIGTKPIYTLGNDNLTNSALNLCNLSNIFAESIAVAPTVNPEQVMQLNPDIIIITNKNVSNFAKRTRYWQDLGLKAAKNHYIYTIDPDQLLRPAPRLIEATQKICELAHSVRGINNVESQ